MDSMLNAPDGPAGLLPHWSAGSPADGPGPWALDAPPSRSAGLQRVAGVRPAAYARTRNHLEGAVTGLSPYLTHGLLTLPEVLQGLLQQDSLPVQHKLVFELGWREYFRHVWAHRGEGILQSLHTGPRPEEACDPVLPPDIRQGRTGLPVIDQAVRTLYATGTLHNHARMWLASYVVHLRQVHWRAGADWLVAHLLDGDLASNHLSWQWVAGTGSGKPYLFNADNVARYAPAHWHSPGTVLDQSYEALARAARSARALAGPGSAHAPASAEPPLLCKPPADLGVMALPGAGPPPPQAHGGETAALPLAAASPALQTGVVQTVAEQLRGRSVWLVHPWALRPPPAGLGGDTVVLGVYLQEHHRAWPWPEARWRWVDAAMAAVAPQRIGVDAAGLAAVLADAAAVRSVDDPHLTRWLGPLARLDAAPALFAPVPRPCGSFSQWWARVTRGLQQAEELL